MTPAARDPQMLKGILPVLVIALLTEQESYGYELVVRLQEAGLEDIAAGTVYPVLTRLEREGHISSRLVASPSGPARKYYLPTPAGTEHLERAAADWRQLARTVEHVLERIAPTTEEPS
ncbi:MAG: PadR family transcriptional regulator [Actinomycetales bacterium]|nr:PadR family transcriptional regulator [Actinomycetales bacterium]